MNLVVRTHNGFGDVIYERPIIRALAKAHEQVFLATAFPEVFSDLDVSFVQAESGLAWSNRNMAAQPSSLWSQPPAGAMKFDIRIKALRYLLKTLSMPEVMAKRAGVVVDHMDLPPLPSCPVMTADPIAVVRPVTLRPDWPHSARNPNPEYMVQAAELLRDAGYHVVSVAAITEHEPYQGAAPFAHTRFDSGELEPLKLLALVKAASLVVTGPGWAVPAAVAAGTPLIVIAGGAGGTNGPRALVPSWHTGYVQWIKPQEFCQCSSRRHQCRKTIQGFQKQFAARLPREPAIR